MHNIRMHNRKGSDKAMDIRSEVEKALGIAAQVAENPLAQSALGLAFVPPSVTAKVGELLQLLDLELSGMTKAAQADPTTTAAPSAAVSAAADVLQPAAASGHSEPDPTQSPAATIARSSPAADTSQSASLTAGAETSPAAGGAGEPDPKAPGTSTGTDPGGPSTGSPSAPLFVPPTVGPPVA